MKKLNLMFRALVLVLALTLLPVTGFQLISSLDLPVTVAATAQAVEAVTAPQDVVDYLAMYGKLPDNFMTKQQAQNMGWNSSKNYLSDVAPGYAIGGDKFGNREKLLPEAKGRQYYECDVNYKGGKRTGERLVYSNDGLYYYTKDGYKTFTQLTPSEGLAEPVDPVMQAAQDVADYLFLYGELPEYFITKKEAENRGWKSNYYYVGDIFPGCAIGGDRFGNYEGALPKAKGRQYYECDCYYDGKARNEYRVVYSNDGLVFFTGDHYETFTQLFPSEWLTE